MAKVKDLTGQTSGRLTALRDTGRRDKHGHSIWLFRCSCLGREFEAQSTSFLQGLTQSCGCLHKERAATRLRVNGAAHPAFKHGHASRDEESRIYRSWASMVARCTNPKGPMHKYYFDAGVKVCDRWLDQEYGFQNFLADMGERPAGTSLGRFPDSGNYEPGNCTWQSPREQGIQKRVHHRLQFLAA